MFLTGPSGAGKTTLLKLLFRAERPSEGQILVNGRNVSIMPLARVPELRRSMGIVFQDYKLLPGRTVLDNVSYVLKFLGEGAGERRRRAYQALRSVELHHRMGAYPEELSGGEQQRVALARALVNDPDILLADEPTGSLDSHTGAQVLECLFALAEEKRRTLVIVTHNAEVAASCVRTIHMKDGRIENS